MFSEKSLYAEVYFGGIFSIQDGATSMRAPIYSLNYFIKILIFDIFKYNQALYFQILIFFLSFMACSCGVKIIYDRI